MAKQFPSFDAAHESFIAQQHIFFVAPPRRTGT